MQTLEINKAILMEKDTLILGLSTRETICAVMGVGLTAGGYFGLQGVLGMQGASWAAIFIGAPFFALGFWKRNGLSIEKYLWAMLKSRMLTPWRRTVSFPNTHYNLLLEEEKEEGGKKHGNQLSKKERLSGQP